MDRDLALKFVEDNDSEVEKLHYQLSLVRSSPLPSETPSGLVASIQVGVSVTHDVREEPLVMGSDEEHSVLLILEESYDSERVDGALSWQCGDHEPFLSKSTLEAQEIIKHLSGGPTHEGVYTSMDWVDRYMIGMDTLWNTDATIICRVLGTVVHMGHRMVQEDTMVCDCLQGTTLAYNSVQQRFGALPLGRHPDRGLEDTINLRLPRI
jgi:hypothetical protein